MHSEATYSLYGMVDRLTALGRSEVFGSPDIISAMAPLNLLFKDKWSRGEALVRMTEASQRLMISKPGATQAVNRLVENGLVERVSDDSDRRVVYIRATQRGREFYEREIDKSLTLFDRVFEHMGEAEAQNFVTLLRRFFDAFDELGIPLCRAGVQTTAGANREDE